MIDSAPIRLAIIGCGAISERGHLPAALTVPQVRVAALVDKDQARAGKLAQRHSGAVVTDDYRTIAGKVDAAVVALPPSLHAPVTIDLLQRGVHVLVEKPMARNVAECDQMIAAARQSGTVLAVGLVRRFRWAYRFAKRLIDAGALGRVESFDVHEGGVFDWPIASPFFLKRDAAGGGVFADAGVHVIDALLWWFGDVAGFEYRDDAMGGVEGDCELELSMTGAGADGTSPSSPIRGSVQLSRTRQMRNTTVIRGTHATLEIHAFSNDVKLTLAETQNDSMTLTGSLSRGAAAMAAKPAAENVMADQLVDFAAAIREKRQPMVPGEQGKRSVAVIESCYARRRPLRHAWVFEGIDSNEFAEIPATSATASSSGRETTPREPHLSMSAMQAASTAGGVA